MVLTKISVMKGEYIKINMFGNYQFLLLFMLFSRFSKENLACGNTMFSLPIDL